MWTRFIISRACLHSRGGEPTRRTPPVLWHAASLLTNGRPYLAFGVRPTVFDAPGFSDVGNVTWLADTFLVYTPDGLLSRVVKPVCGFAWGYELKEGTPTVLGIEVADRSSWEAAATRLAGRFDDWAFGSSFPDAAV
jgi:hypothetical protein